MTSTAEQAPAAETADAIPVLREQIDAMDEAILRLVAERAKLSRRPNGPQPVLKARNPFSRKRVTTSRICAGSSIRSEQ